MNNTQKILAALLKPSVKLEAAQQQLATMRGVDDATGFTLTLNGKLVGQEREGVTEDELFRRYVRARVSSNKSDGVGEDALTIARLVITETGAELVFDNQGAAAYVLRIDAVDVGWDAIKVLIRLLRRATSAGVRAMVEWLPQPPAETFAYAALDGSDPDEGFGYGITDGTDGGKYASVIE